MEPLTAIWANWVEAANKQTEKHENLSDAFSLTFIWLERNFTELTKLKKQGCCIPARRSLRSALESGLEALPEETNHLGKPQTMCTFWHCLNLLWQPICTYIEDLLRGMAPKWSSELEMNNKALLLEMDGAVSSPDKALTQEDWYIFCTRLS